MLDSALRFDIVHKEDQDSGRVGMIAPKVGNSDRDWQLKTKRYTCEPNSRFASSITVRALLGKLNCKYHFKVSFKCSCFFLGGRYKYNLRFLL